MLGWLQEVDGVTDAERDQRFPTLAQVVLDTTDVRALAEFYRCLLGLRYRPGDAPPPPGQPDDQDWLVLRNDSGPQLAFQEVETLPPATWPDGPIPQQLHLDMTVGSVEELETQHDRALRLGGTLLLDRIDDPEEPLRVYADPAGHPFCIFVVDAQAYAAWEAAQVAASPGDGTP